MAPFPPGYACGYKRSFPFSNHFLSHYLALFFLIHYPCNRVKRSNNLEVEIAPKHFLLGMFDTLDDNDSLCSSTHNFS